MKGCFASQETEFGNTVICGIDEAGRGPLAGPVVAAAVILPEGFSHPSIRDSKKLTRKKISEAAVLVKAAAVAVGIGVKDAAFIDRTDILTATFRAMEDAVANLAVVPGLILIDGNLTNPYLRQFTQRAMVKGDDRFTSIAAASIIAKDFRDSLMEEYGREFPRYRFEKHKGYGTSHHIEMLRAYGPSPIHRRSFLKTLLAGSNEGRLL